MRSPIARRTSMIGVATILSVLVVVGSSSAAFAQDSITLTPATQTAEYGQGWYVQGQITPFSGCDACYGDLVATADSSTQNLGGQRLYQGQFTIGDGDLLPATDLGVGTHSISVAFTSSGTTTATSSAPAKVTITPAAIVVTTTITPDPYNSSNAIVAAALSGDYINQLPTCYCEDAGLYNLPAGTWSLTVTDSSGKVALSKQVQQPGSGNPYLVDYWQNVPPGETFSAQTTFAVSGSASANFALTSQKFSYTSAKPAGGGGAVVPPHSPAPKPTKPAAFAPPLFVCLSVLVVALLLAAIDVILIVRRRRTSTASASTADVSPIAEEPAQ